MKLYEQIDHALDIKARIQDYIDELNKMESDISPVDVVIRLNSIFNKAEDARFELNSRQADLELDIS